VKRHRKNTNEADAAATTAVARISSPIAVGERQRIGDLLLSQNLVDPTQLSAALNLQRASGRQLGAILVEQGLLDPRVLTQALAAQLGLPTIDLRQERPTAEAMALVPEAVARRLMLVPMRLIDGVLDVAVADGADPAVAEQLAQLPVTEVKMYLAPSRDVQFALDSHYRVLVGVDEETERLWAEATQRDDPRSELIGAQDAPVIQLVNRIVAQAVRDRASDIHLEPTDGRIRVRYRVDGALHEVLSLPIAAGPELVSRIKIMAEMDIVERRRPQDGQFNLEVDGAGIDVRVATAATIWGETAVLRILDKSRSLKRMSDLGMPAATYERYLTIAHRPFGMLICSGPTGSGKTTTLYATLAELDRAELNVMTIEDPVEYVYPSANQMQINLQADVTFAAGLRSILRQDPDVILVGEMRDLETASIAVQAALTGHLVLSSLHATDASSALFRLLDMGVEPFLVASSVVGIVGQRLVRRVCEACAGPYSPTVTELIAYERLGGQSTDAFMSGSGCNFCLGTGYRGRVGVYELLEVTEEVSQRLVSGATPHELRHYARAQGMPTMGTEAMALVANGVTTIDEVIRSVYLS